MMKINGFSTNDIKYHGKKEKRKKICEYKIDNSKNCKEQEQIKSQEEIKEQNCFALVVVRKLPWYRKIAKNIRNFFVVYRWRKAR